MLHIVIDVVGPGLSHFHARLKIGGHAFMPAGVVDRLALGEEVDRLIDTLRRLGYGGGSGKNTEQSQMGKDGVHVFSSRRDYTSCSERFLKMTRRNFLTAAGLGGARALGAAKERPNVVFIISDQIHHAVPCKTPNL